MISMTLADIAEVIGVLAPTGSEGITVSSVEFDSRAVTPGALFVALPGDRADGHDFAEAAAASGAVAMLGSRPVPALPTLVAGEGGAAVLRALSLLASHVARRLIADGLTVVGITGSSGKTSTKDLTAAVLARHGSVVAPKESFNNELGHPYTVLRAGLDTDYLVLELSARGIGHIAALTAVAPPRIGVVLNVGSAHLGEFGSRDAIAVAKGELVEALPPAQDGGVAVLNAEDDRVAAMASRTNAAVVRTGLGPHADIRAVDIVLDHQACASFTLRTPEDQAPVRLRVVGEHQVSNALAAAAVGRAVGMTVHEIAEALSEATPVSRWRMALENLPGGSGVTVINDAYNANPESARAALEALSRFDADREKWAVLGEMAELGDAAPAAHHEVGRYAAELGIRVVAVGNAARAIADGARERGSDHHTGWPDRPAAVPIQVADMDEAMAALLKSVRPRSVLLVKASRAVGLQRLAERLVRELPTVLADGAANDGRQEHA